MSELTQFLINTISGSSLQSGSLFLLRNVPGFPPIIQTIHILGISIVMGTIVILNLRILHLAVPSQNVKEMIPRLMPWFWSALLVNAVSGSVFIFALPARYFNNPIFIWKLSFLIPAIILAFLFHYMSKRQDNYWCHSEQRIILSKLIAMLSLALWLMVPMAGRWIAYAEYIYYPA